MVEAEEVADLVIQNRVQIHAILFALVAGDEELAVVPRRPIDEPAPAGGVGVEVGGVPEARPSNTQPIVRVIAEAMDETAATGLCKEVGVLAGGGYCQWFNS